MPDIIPGVPAPQNGREYTQPDPVVPTNDPPAAEEPTAEEPAAEEGQEDIFKTVSFSDFKNPNKIDEPIEEPVKEETPEVKPLPPTRDYSEIAQEDVEYFKKMGNATFARMKPIYLEHRKHQEIVSAKEQELTVLKSNALPTDYFSHPNGYLLDPSYGKLAQSEYLAREIANHWKQQLINVRTGKDWQDLKYDEKGQLSKTEAKPASPEDEADILQQVTGTQMQWGKLQQDLQMHTQSFHKKHKEDVAFIDSVAKQYFPDYEKPDHPTAKIQQEILRGLPESFRNSPVSKLLKYSGAANALMKVQLRQMEDENKKLKGIKKDQQNAPPPSKSFLPGSTDVSPRVTFSDFQKAKEEYAR